MATEFTQILLEGRPHWLHESGRILPVVSGGSDTPPAVPPPPPAPIPDSAAPPVPPATETVTKAELDRQVAAASKAAEKTAKEAIDAYLAQAKADADKSTMDEATRAKAEAEEAKTEAAADRALAAKERFDARVERKLSAAGVGKDADEKAATAAMARAMRLVTLESDADDAAIDAEIESIKADVPGLFGPPTPGTPPPAPSGVVPGGGPPNTPPAKDVLEAGRARAKTAAAQRTGSTKDDLLADFGVPKSPFATAQPN